MSCASQTEQSSKAISKLALYVVVLKHVRRGPIQQNVFLQNIILLCGGFCSQIEIRSRGCSELDAAAKDRPYRVPPVAGEGVRYKNADRPDLVFFVIENANADCPRWLPHSFDPGELGLTD